MIDRETITRPNIGTIYPFTLMKIISQDLARREDKIGTVDGIGGGESFSDWNSILRINGEYSSTLYRHNSGSIKISKIRHR